MQFRTRVLGIGVMATAFASACSSGNNNTGDDTSGIGGFGGLGAPLYGGAAGMGGGDQSFGSGGYVSGGSGGFSYGGASPNGGASGMQNIAGASGSPGAPNGAGGEGTAGAQNGAGGEGTGGVPNGTGGVQNGAGGVPNGAGGVGAGGVPNGAGGAGSGGAGSGGAGSGGAQSGTGGAGAGGAQNGTGGNGAGPTGPDPTSDSASKQGSCTVQSYTSGVAGGADYVTPTVYYPTNCDAPYPGVVVIPGFTEVQGAINQWGTFLASHGFVVMTVDTAASGVANTLVVPAARASGLAEAVKTLQGENTRSGSPLSGKLDVPNMAVMGHSMGGGGTLLAANAHPEYTAAIGLCPWNPGITYPNDTVPSLFFDGSADTLVPPSQSLPEYQSIPTTTQKAYVEFNGGSHLVANTPLGAAATDKIVARIGLSWLMVHMRGDTRYQQFIAKDATTMSNFDIKP